MNPKEEHIFLDEIIFVKEWNAAILHLFNAGYVNGPTRLYVSGSSSVSLLNETFPGRRIAKKVFYPLNFLVYFNTFCRNLDVSVIEITRVEELFENAKKLIPYLPELNRALVNFAQRCGFLAANYAEGDPLNTLYETYRDAIVSEVARLGYAERLLFEVVQKLVEPYGSRVPENKIAQDASISSHNTVASYLDLSEKLFVLSVFTKLEPGGKGQPEVFQEGVLYGSLHISSYEEVHPGRMRGVRGGVASRYRRNRGRAPGKRIRKRRVLFHK